MEHEGDGDTSSNLNNRNNSERIGKGTKRLGNKKTSGDQSDYSINKIAQNTEKSPGNLGRVAVTHVTNEKPLVNAGVKISQRSIITNSSGTLIYKRIT